MNSWIVNQTAKRNRSVLQTKLYGKRNKTKPESKNIKNKRKEKNETIWKFTWNILNELWTITNSICCGFQFQLYIGFVDMVHALVQFILKFSQAHCAIRNANEYDLISIIKSFVNRVQITFCIKYCFELQSPLGSLHRHSY